MLKYTPEQIKEIYKNLPDDVKEAIFSVDTSNILRKIGEKYKLTIEQMGEMADETGLLMLGLTQTKDFISNLSERLQADKDISRQIAKDINTEVFSIVRESLRKVHSLGNAQYDVPQIMQGSAAEIKLNPFERKSENEIYRMPVQEKKYKQNDPYREPI